MIVFLWINVVVALLVAAFFAAGIRIVRPTHRGLVERLGRYHRFQGFALCLPEKFVERRHAHTT